MPQNNQAPVSVEHGVDSLRKGRVRDQHCCIWELCTIELGAKAHPPVLRLWRGGGGGGGGGGCCEGGADCASLACVRHRNSADAAPVTL